jgi:hypothetical protein
MCCVIQSKHSFINRTRLPVQPEKNETGALVGPLSALGHLRQQTRKTAV